MMNPIQEAEFHLSVYHYFLWKSAQAKAREDELKSFAVIATPTAQGLASAAATSDPVSEERDKIDVDKKLPAVVTETKTANDDKEGESTPASPSAAILAAAITPNSKRYQALVDAMLEQFPQHLAHFLSNSSMMTQVCPPIITTLYSDFPAMQAEINVARNRIAHLENLTLDHTLQTKRKEPPDTAAVEGGPQKRSRIRTSNTELTQHISISNRPDVPDDVKKLVAKFCQNANKQKRNEKKKVSRLEAQIAKHKATAEDGSQKVVPNAGPTLSSLPQPASGALAEPANPKPPTSSSHWKSNASFEDRVKELEHFRKGNGHCRVPLRQPGLGRWVGEMRLIYKNVQHGATGTILTPENIALLEGMGFEWSLGKPMVPWETRFHDLLKFKEATGNCNVPRSYKEDPSLGEWVHMQRKLFRQKTKGMVEAPEEGGVSRAERLMEVGFMWHTGAVKPSFEERLDECREFRRKHDHLKVPLPAKYNKEDQSAYETREERSFLQWAQRQRDDYRKYNEGMKSSLDKNRIKKLDELGFDWEVDRKSGLSSLSGERTGARGKPKNHVAFNERIRTLSEIKDIYGDVNDIKNLKAAGHPETSPLYQWMKAQRKAWKALKSGRWSSLTQERIALLQSVDFNFQPRRHYAAYGSCKNSQSPEGTFRTGDEAAREVDDQYSSDQQETEFEEDDEEPLPPPPPGYERYRV